MANEQNLLKKDDLTASERRENARKAGVASGKARKERKQFRETLELLLSMQIDSKKAADIEKVTAFKGLKGKNVSVQEAILIAQVQKAMKGDKGAAEYVRDTVGEKPDNKINLGGTVNNPMAGLTTEELKKLIYDG